MTRLDFATLGLTDSDGVVTAAPQIPGYPSIMAGPRVPYDPSVLRTRPEIRAPRTETLAEYIARRVAECYATGLDRATVAGSVRTSLLALGRRIDLPMSLVLALAGDDAVERTVWAAAPVADWLDDTDPEADWSWVHLQPTSLRQAGVSARSLARVLIDGRPPSQSTADLIATLAAHDQEALLAAVVGGALDLLLDQRAA